MVALYAIGQTIKFMPWFLLLSSSSFSHRLISAVAGWMSAIHPHMVWLSARLAGNAGRKNYEKKSPSGHHRTTYIFATTARIDNRKEVLSSNMSPTMSSQYGEFRPTSGWHRLATLGQIGTAFASWNR